MQILISFAEARSRIVFIVCATEINSKYTQWSLIVDLSTTHYSHISVGHESRGICDKAYEIH